MLISKPQNLTQERCQPCQKNEKALTRAEAEIWLEALTGWALDDKAEWLNKTYKTSNFNDALALANRMGKIAEAEQHHPDISLGWGYVTVRLQTHAICGLHRNDFILASKIDRMVLTA